MELSSFVSFTHLRSQLEVDTQHLLKLNYGGLETGQALNCLSFGWKLVNSKYQHLQKLEIEALNMSSTLKKDISYLMH